MNSKYKIDDYTKPYKPDEMKVVFSFENVVNITYKGYNLKSLTKEEKSQLLDAITKRSSLTWSEIKSLPRNTLGYELMDIDNIKKFPDNLKNMGLDKVMIFRIKSKTTSRLMGYRDPRFPHVFQIIMYDKKGEAYPHGS